MPRRLIVIPARLASSRLPDKPLADIAGKPMVLRVHDLCVSAGLGQVAVATDSEAIADCVRQAGATAVMTRSDHQSGTDRVAEAVGAIDPDRRFDIIVNMQGDYPTLDPHVLQAAVDVFDRSEADIATVCSVITDEAEKTDPNAPRLIGTPVAEDLLRALYFTRGIAPWGDGPHYHHIGLYAFRRAALERFVALEPSPLEQRERLEQLRALEAGMRIDAAIVEAAPIGVDTPADLALARAHFSSAL
ncbi:MAG: 3-deoxy-manno-octulosonate cytidylyltransferase [Pseudomonadota bacterium]